MKRRDDRQVSPEVNECIAVAASKGDRNAERYRVPLVPGLRAPLLAGVYRLSDFHRAQTDFMAKGFVGKLVVVPDAKWEVARRTGVR